MIEKNNGHWQIEDYRQRMTSKQWKELLLQEEDMIIVKGRLRRLVAKNLGYGVVEIYKKPLKKGA